ncbi:MAG TPA: glycosyl transferase family 2 [Candidatus Margulisbacteria bacterium]|nr:glycosyl transferase family 2 [Candidatus Margulisiibacteriota bacterium]
MAPKVSIIVRSRNEERWITPCLKSVFNQTFKDFEVILVDNKSTDKTVEKAKQFEVTVVEIDKYLPGKAINVGIEASCGSYIAILSSHCIPTNEFWLENLVRNLDEDTNQEIAGVYGRQEPLAFTHDLDKRDLLITFGLDRRVQIKDSFFHNANSLVRKSVVETIPFDDTATNIEDRLWGKEIINHGYKIVYEPQASVYHHHGIHQSGDPQRAHNIVKIMESMNEKEFSSKKINHLDLNIMGIITAKGDPFMFNNKPLIEYTIKSAQQSKLLNNLIVSTDSVKTKEIAQAHGVNVPFLRPQKLSNDDIGVEAVLQYTLDQLEKSNIFPDIIVYLSIIQPFRPVFLIDELISMMLKKGFDSVLPGYPSYKSCWIKKEGSLVRVDEGFVASSQKHPIHIGYAGLACVTYAEFIRKGHLLGNNVGISEIVDFYSTIELKTPASFELAEKAFHYWWGKQEEYSVQR